MKILHTVQCYHPKGGGMYEVVKQLSERLSILGHSIVVATGKLPENTREQNGVKVTEFDLSGNSVSGIKGDVEKYQDFLINSDFDIITNFAAQQPMTDAMLPILDRIKAKKVFVPTGFSAFYNKKYKDYFNNMKEWIGQYDMNVFLSNNYRDINFARENKIKKYTVIPNGADENEFLKNNNNIDIRAKLNIPKDNFFILHIGSHTGLKGHSEAIKIFNKAKIKNSSFLIVGNDGNCLKSCATKEKKLNNSKNYKSNNKKLIIRHLSREGTVAAYKGADLFLFPSNIECSPIVLFECMASKTPFLTTDVGNAGEIIQWSDGGILLPIKRNPSFNVNSLSSLKKYIRRIVNDRHNLSTAKIQKSAKLLENLYNNKTARKEMSKSGYEVWLEKFTWKKIAGDYENLYQKLISNKL